MNYKEYKEQKQSEFNKLPIFFAFSNEQFKEQMEQRGLKETDVDKIYSLGDGSGGFFLKSDRETIRDFFNKEDNLIELMQDFNFAVDAFEYEMANHEYDINMQGDFDVCMCFCNENVMYGKRYDGGEKTYKDYLMESGYEWETVKAYAQARQNFLERRYNEI